MSSVSDIKSAFFTNAAALRKTESLSVPGMGSLTIRGLNGAEYDAFESASTVKKPDGSDPQFIADRATVLRYGVIDPETGNHVFSDEDLVSLRGLPAAALLPIAKAILRLSGVGEDAGKN